MDGPKRIRISTHNHLRELYEEACRSRKSLKVVFQEPAQARDGEGEDKSEADWGNSGSWEGGTATGWDGGFSYIQKSGIGNTRDSSRILPRAMERSTIAMSVPGGRRLSSSGSNPERKKSTSFAETISTVRFFRTDSPPRRDRPDLASLVPTAESLPPSDSSNAFRDAVQNGTPKAVVEALNVGAPSDERIIDRILEEQYIKLKEALEHIKRASQNGSPDAVLTRGTELKEKEKILKIYINAFFAIDKAFSLDSWSRFEFRIRSIELHKSVGTYAEKRSRVLTVCAKLKVGTQIQKLVSERDLPSMTLS